MDVEENQSNTPSQDIPQNCPLTAGQVPNSAGGYTWKVSDLNRLRRFLCFGAEGGTYYIKEQDLGIENAQCINRLIEEGKGQEVLNELIDFSTNGRAAKQNPIIFSLAMCARQDKDAKLKAEAYKALSDICRIPTHLFNFVEYCEKLSKGTGWGRAHRRAVQTWYNKYKDDPKRLSMHVTKYQNRNGWCHRDLFRLCHLKPASDNVAVIARYIIKGLEVAKEDFDKPEALASVLDTLSFLQSVEKAKKCSEPSEMVYLIEQHHLVREHVPTTLLKSVEVWKALLKHMPMTAMIRNLGKMSSIGLLPERSDEEKIVVGKLNDQEALQHAKIHPLNVLVALKTYEQGKGEKGKLKWEANKNIVRALETAFYKSFKFVEPTGKRHLLAIDVSGSMDFLKTNGSLITPREAAAAMSMVTARTERDYEMIGFSHKLVHLPIHSDMDLQTVIQSMRKVPMGGTDCAQPMLWAKEQKKKFDVFVVYTDCETWAGKVHPAETLVQYRAAMGIWDAKLIVVAMTSNGFTLADPDDPGMLDMAGFDSAAPEVMRNFTLGLL